MATKRGTVLEIEQLSDRIMPSTTAIFSNGLLLVQGDNAGNSIQVAARTDGTLQVTDHGVNVAIAGTAPTLTNLRILVEQSGSGQGYVLATDKSLGTIPTYLDATLGRDNVLTPGNSGSSTEVGGHGINWLISGPGPDVLLGGTDAGSRNLFDWEPGTGTDVVVGRGGHNSLLVVGNTGGKGEMDQVDADGRGGFVYSRLNVVPFKIFASHVDTLVIRPSSGDDQVTVNDLTGVPGLERVEVDGGDGNDTIDFSRQRNAGVRAIFNGGNGTNTYIAGAGVNDFLDSNDNTQVIPPHSGKVVNVSEAREASYLADFDAFQALLSRRK